MNETTSTSDCDFSFTLWDTIVEYSTEDDENEIKEIDSKKVDPRLDQSGSHLVNKSHSSTNSLTSAYNLFILTKIKYFKSKASKKSSVHKIVNKVSTTHVMNEIHSGANFNKSTLSGRNTIEWMNRKGFPSENLLHYVENLLTSKNDYSKVRTKEGWFLITNNQDS